MSNRTRENSNHGSQKSTGKKGTGKKGSSEEGSTEEEVVPATGNTFGGRE
jgi:hypothetical protein